MEYRFAFALILLVAGCSSVQADGEGDGSSEYDPFNMSYVLQLIKKLAVFQELVLEHNDTLNLQELRAPVHAAFEKGVQCFQDELKNANAAILKIMTDFRKSVTGDNPDGEQGNQISAPLRLVGAIQKLIAAFQSPEVQTELKDLRGLMKSAFQAGKDCFIAAATADTGIPKDKYDLFKKLWEKAMNS